MMAAGRMLAPAVCSRASTAARPRVAVRLMGASASFRTGSPLAFRASPNVSNTAIRRGNLAPAHLTHTSRSLSVVAAEGGKGGKKGKGKKEDNVYGHTVLLPKTDFEMRANSVTKEPAIQQWWADNKIYEQIAERTDAEMFTLHDGPPYANGDLHIGHALNKILKDFVNRYQMMKGKQVRYVPGWDCHGLPIELKVLQSMDADARKALTPIKLRKKARNFALKTVDKQRDSFKRYGVWGDWEDPYLTLLPEYEAAQMEVFGQMFLNGHVYRGKKPVHWSPSSMTALAEAELEYPEGHVSQSVYVAFPLVTDEELPDAFPAEHKDAVEGASLAVWTTTPWTMPANAAVAVNDKLEYSFVKVTGTAGDDDKESARMVGKTLVVANGLITELQKTLGLTLELVCTVPGSALVGFQYTHPMYDRVSPVVAGGDYITTESGTGLVHTAPGHGQEDYMTGLKFGLPLLSPVDDQGKFTEEAGDDLVGKSVLKDGNEACIEKLRESNALILQEPYNHKYPYDWRTKKPTIFRATEQWFASVEGFREEALAELDKIEFVPASGAKRMRPMVSGRNDWCISRQRSWGVPIPCFYDKDTKEPLMDKETIEHVTEIVRTKGTDAWWELDLVDLLPDGYKDKADSLVKGTDTMDVWFDSGSSWAGVVKSRGLKYPADMYLEGSDQHRGWFQSSLLTGVAAAGRAPYEKILTHGFVLDEKGYKMSKSLGNVIDPKLIIEGGKNQKTDPAFGADTLRLWVASTDYTSDVLIGTNILKQTSDSYRKLRGTLRFLMGNIGDFNPATDAVPYEQLPSFDRYALRRTADMLAEMDRAYETHQYSQVTAQLQSFTAYLSNVYLDASKDRLYVESPTGDARRCAQTVINEIVTRLLCVVAPIAPHMAEEAFTALPYTPSDASVFLRGWVDAPNEWTAGMDDDEAGFWATALAIRGEVNRAIETARGDKTLGASLEAKAVIYASDAALAKTIESRAEELKQAFIVSQFEVVSSADDVTAVCGTQCVSEITAAQAKLDGIVIGMDDGAVVKVGVCKADGAKCARCWGYFGDLGSDDRHPELCPRCTPIVIEKDPDLRVPAKKAEEVAA